MPRQSKVQLEAAILLTVVPSDKRLRIAPPPGERWVRKTPSRDDEATAAVVAYARRAFDRVFLITETDWLAEMEPLNQQAALCLLMHQCRDVRAASRIPPKRETTARGRGDSLELGDNRAAQHRAAPTRVSGPGVSGSKSVQQYLGTAPPALQHPYVGLRTCSGMMVFARRRSRQLRA
jgi:hypothetical protein